MIKLTAPWLYRARFHFDTRSLIFQTAKQRPIVQK